MSPREADKIIKSGKSIVVIGALEDEPWKAVFVRRDRWNIYSADGGVFDRGELKVVDENERDA